MASKQTGVAVVFGFPGNVAFTGSGTFFQESGSFEQDIKIDEVRDEDNELRTLIHSGETIEGNLMFTPRAAAGTNTLANAKLSLAPPAKGAQVTLTLFALAALNAADWVYVGGWKIDSKKDGVTTYAMKIKRSPNNDISVAVS